MDPQVEQEENGVEENETETVESKQKSLPPIKNCRFYETEFPEVAEIVMVRIDELNDFCAFVTLLEYNLPASIQFTEISNRRLRQTPSSLLKIGKQEVMQVLRVDEEKGYIDLTKKNVDAKEIAECTERFNKSKTVHSIMAHAITEMKDNETKKIELEDIYKKMIWPIYKGEKYEHPIEAFQAVISDNTVFDEFGLDEEFKDLLIKDISHRLATQQVKVQATVEVTCFTYEGIDAIIPSLKAGREASQKAGNEVKIALISTPLYSLTTSAMDQNTGLKAIQNAIDVITQEIEKRKGNLKVAVEPAVVTV